MSTSTDRELAAATRLAHSFLEFVLAVEAGIAARSAARPRPEVRVVLDRPNPEQEVEPAPTEPSAPVADGGLLDAKEVSRMLGVSDRTVWMLSAPRGPLLSVKIGRAVRYRPEDVLAYIKRRTAKPNPHVR